MAMKSFIIFAVSLGLLGCAMFKYNENEKYYNLDCRGNELNEVMKKFPSYIPQGSTERLSNQLQWNIQNQNNTNMNNTLKNFPAR